MEKWDVNVTNMFFPKLSLITVFDERKYCSKLFTKIIIVYSFSDFMIKPKWNISKNVSITFKLSKKTEEIERFTYCLLFVVSKNA